MYLEIDTTHGRTEVREPEDLKRFSVRTGASPDPEAVSRSLEGLGRLDGADHAWIDIRALREATGRAGDPAWVESFEKMVSYAASKGWVNEEGTALRAHLDRGDAVG